MTNGEKMKELFPQGIISYSGIFIIFDINGYCQQYSPNWWNAEYKEPTNTIDYRRAFKIACDLLNGDVLYGLDTDKIYELMMQKDEVVSSSSYEEYILNHLQDLDQGQYVTENCIACKYDETEEEDGEHCKKCLAGDNQFELDKEFVEPTTKNYIAHNLCDSCTNIGCEFQSGIVRTECVFYMPPQLEPDNCGNYVVQDSTTKNNLGVDCISREQAINAVNMCSNSETILNLQQLPSVTPQNQVCPLCEDCHNKMDEVRRAYDNAMKQEPILNKIRAEIEQKPYGIANDSVIQGMKYERAAILAIFDKYKAESEDV